MADRCPLGDCHVISSDEENDRAVDNTATVARKKTNQATEPNETEFGASQCPTDNMALLNVLLSSPEDVELKSKPSAIRKNFFCTLNSTCIPIASAMADDNGAYTAGGQSKKLYYVTFDSDNSIKETKSVTQSKDGDLYYCQRAQGESRTTYKKMLVPDRFVYELTRTYRKNKANPALQHMIVTVRRKDKKAAEDFYISSYRLDANVDELEFEDSFKNPRHGNALKPTAANYYRTDNETLLNVENALEKKLSCDEIYNSYSKTSVATVSADVRNPRQIHNIKKKMEQRANESKKGGLEQDEIERMVIQMRDSSNKEAFTRAITILQTHFVSIHFLDESVADVVRFCVKGASVFRADTTFEIIENFWVTDTSYTNSSLLCEHTGKHPEFPGPLMLHFRKDKPTYRTFAAHLVAYNPYLLDIKKIGTDMDKAIAGGLGDIFPKADKLVCLQHLMERDSMQLAKMGATKRAKDRIMADTYGSKQERMLQFGLADADDEDDFNVKFLSLQDVWEEVVPGYHLWFERHRSQIFKETIIGKAKDRMGLDGNFFNNRLEVMHKLQKKLLKEKDIGKEVTQVISALQEWMTNYRSEAIKALRGMGKYRLAPGYEQFAVDPTKWFRWSIERQQQHCDAFFSYNPTISEGFQRPVNAGLKGNEIKRKRRDQEEAQIFVNRFENIREVDSNHKDAEPKTITPIKIQKTSEGSYKMKKVKRNENAATAMNDPLDPMRIETKIYHLVHSEDTANRPKSVKRCQECMGPFTNADVVTVKTIGIREFTDKKTGKQKRQSGNIYLHYLKQCLKNYDPKFTFPAIVVLKETLNRLPVEAVQKFRRLGLQLEE